MTSEISVDRLHVTQNITLEELIVNRNDNSRMTLTSWSGTGTNEITGTSAVSGAPIIFGF